MIQFFVSLQKFLAGLSAPDGPTERFHRNGQLKFKGTYRKGREDGPCEQYYDNGQIEFRGNFKDGKRDGVWQIWHRNGRLKVKGRSIPM